MRIFVRYVTENEAGYVNNMTRKEEERMNREEARQYVKDRLEDYLQWKGINTRRQFRCLNPDHSDNNPSMSLDRNARCGIHCKCFSCGAYYDTFDLIGIDYGLTADADKFKKAYEIFQLTPDRSGSSAPLPPKGENRSVREGEKLDFTEEVEIAHRALLENRHALEHFQSRGLSMEIIEDYKLGYDEQGHNHFLRNHPENQCKSQKEWLYQYIIPYPDAEGRFTYFQTEILNRASVDEYNGKYRKINKGETGLEAQIFNERYIQTMPPVVFICEGIYDALSVEEAGGKAIAFSGTAHRRFLGLCKKYMPNTTFIISLDNDTAGQNATQKVKEGLDSLQIRYIVRTAEQGKDFNEALQKDRDEFIEFVRRTEEEASMSEQKAKEEERQAYLKQSAAYNLQSFIDNIEKSKNASYFPTGFTKLDELLDGGLHSGLYIIGAISSLGKTTFCLQIMDTIAATGQDVLVFSLEMAKEELIAKSISRLSLQEDLINYQTTTHAKTVRGIMTGKRYSNYSQEEMGIIMGAMNEYSKYADHIFIHEGIGNIGVEQVRNEVEKHIRITGKAPVVLIDYLQILAPADPRATDKQNTDKNVMELKRMSRDLSRKHDCTVPVIGISSFNRENYSQPVNMAAFKESGAIEYSSDVLIALQYSGMDYQEGEVDGKERSKRIRKLVLEQIWNARIGQAQNIQVKVLKNRNGVKGDYVLDFYPRFNYFAEKGKSGIAGEEPEWEPVEEPEWEAWKPMEAEAL